MSGYPKTLLADKAFVVHDNGAVMDGREIAFRVVYEDPADVALKVAIAEALGIEVLPSQPPFNPNNKRVRVWRGRKRNVPGAGPTPEIAAANARTVEDAYAFGGSFKDKRETADTIAELLQKLGVTLNVGD